LRDLRSDVEVALAQFPDDIVGQERDTEAGPRQVGRPGDGRQTRLTDRGCAEKQRGEGAAGCMSNG
jgi:hypothetical protein